MNDAGLAVSSAEYSLDGESRRDHNAPVGRTAQADLIERLRKATETRGVRVRAAKAMGISEQRLSNILKKPNANYTRETIDRIEKYLAGLTQSVTPPADNSPAGTIPSRQEDLAVQILSLVVSLPAEKCEVAGDLLEVVRDILRDSNRDEINSAFEAATAWKFRAASRRREAAARDAQTEDG